MGVLSTAALLAAIPTARPAGYGDVDADGLPSWSERELHLYTNAARVDPEAFEDDYNQGGCSFYEDFSEDEQTPKSPVYYSRPLNDVARFHSRDMKENGCFQHDSCDGTPIDQRIAEYYDEGGWGENIAMGYPDNWTANFQGWMCSHEGHRANIMSASWHELGTGVILTWYTQDFGAGQPDTGGAIAMGVHLPEAPVEGDPVTFYADYQGEGPSLFEVVLDSEPTELSLLWGEADRGVYSAEATPLRKDGPCHQYYFIAQDPSGESRFPETGSYLFGQDCDEPLMWTEGQLRVMKADDVDPEALARGTQLVGCATGGSRLGGLGLLAGLLLAASRRGSA